MLCDDCKHLIKTNYAEQIGAPAHMGIGFTILICDHYGDNILDEIEICNFYEKKEVTK